MTRWTDEGRFVALSRASDVAAGIAIAALVSEHLPVALGAGAALGILASARRRVGTRLEKEDQPC